MFVIQEHDMYGDSTNPEIIRCMPTSFPQAEIQTKSLFNLVEKALYHKKNDPLKLENLVIDFVES